MIFLHGGGDNPQIRADTFGRFVRAATIDRGCSLALIVVEPDPEQARESFEAYRAIFASLPDPPEQIHPLLISVREPLRPDHLQVIKPTGVFVCGGSTPLYHRALCSELDWVSYLLNAGIPYGGTSAGAAIAANQAILGGWQIFRAGKTRPILFSGASEGLDPLTVRAGLGLVPFAVDVHASQWGTVSRLLQAVDTGLVSTGWAIDENTVLQVENDTVSVYGQGQAYRVWRSSGDGPICINIYQDSDVGNIP